MSKKSSEEKVVTKAQRIVNMPSLQPDVVLHTDQVKRPELPEGAGTEDRRTLSADDRKRVLDQAMALLKRAEALSVDGADRDAPAVPKKEGRHVPGKRPPQKAEAQRAAPTRTDVTDKQRAAAQLRNAQGNNVEPKLDAGRSTRLQPVIKDNRVVLIVDGRHYVAPIDDADPKQIADALYEFAMRDSADAQR